MLIEISRELRDRVRPAGGLVPWKQIQPGFTVLPLWGPRRMQGAREPERVLCPRARPGHYARVKKPPGKAALLVTCTWGRSPSPHDPGGSPGVSFRGHPGCAAPVTSCPCLEMPQAEGQPGPSGAFCASWGQRREGEKPPRLTPLLDGAPWPRPRPQPRPQLQSPASPRPAPCPPNAV